MKNDNEMVIRMFAYDVRFAITHSKAMDQDTGEITLYFPHSIVIYPEKNDAIPDHLRCRVVFQDNSEHIYKVPTIKIQTYSLKEIKEKHLTMFIPYTILRLRPRIKANPKHPRSKHPLTQKELTEFVEEAIFVLKEELSDGYLTELEYHDYVRLFYFAIDRVLRQHPQLRKEAYQMTEPMIKLPSVIIKELQAELADKDAKLEDKNAKLADKDAELADKNAKLADKDTKLADKDAKLADKDAELADKEAELADKDAELADKDAEIQRLKELLHQLSPDNAL